MSELTLRLESKPVRVSRRASVRYRCDRQPSRRVFLVESYQNITAEVNDVSAGGVGLLCDRSLDVGTLLFIDLVGMDIGIEFLARVVHSTQCDDGRCLMGCQFERPLSKEDLAMILGGQG